MSTIMPESQNIRRAVKWVGEELEQGKNLKSLLAEVGMRFNLNPKDEQFIKKFFKEPENIPKG